ncbi:gamma-glutamyltransferase [Egibacter rhizosphaerae]|uniref:Gamma-glutamyltransferase n=1 Tax=Egibacter rhizosphaerae TaxID=1670831 RepID=A0A411YAM7_9ACTN|nr:gamma-glutamyltransferase [Egibacter rhizosphaerae]QBI18232.1 gamma-glutamyltransferase [Egibacter rhizosphaerae]
MTNRWINVVLGVVVVAGLIGVAIYEQPRRAEERAELLGEEVDVVEGEIDADLEPVRPSDEEAGDGVDEGDGEEDAPAETTSSGDTTYGVSAGHPLAVDVGMDVLEDGGNAMDAAVAASYALGVVEPFGSGLGGGGALVRHEPGEEPQAYDYREIAPQSGEIPASDIGVPGFAAGMAHVHEAHGTGDLERLIEPAIALAEQGIEVDDYLAQRLEDAAPRLPINRLPRMFPEGEPLESGDALVQPEHAEALQRVRDEGPEAIHGGEIGERVAEEVSGLELGDFEPYEVEEVPVARGSFAGYEVLAGGPPVSGPPLVQQLQISEALGVEDLDPEGAAYHHAVAQAWRSAEEDRTVFVSDPAFEDVPLEELLDTEYTDEKAAAIPDDGFVEVDEETGTTSPESETTHLVVVDPDGTMVSVTNTLSNFFGSGLQVEGFFLNDQLKNFSRDPESINSVEPGKRPRSFITPVIVADGDEPLLGLGSPGGRRIPSMLAQVLIRWAHHDETLAEATEAPRFHLEGRELEMEESPSGDLEDGLVSRGYEIVDDVPFTEYFGAVQALSRDPGTGDVSGVADDRRTGSWRAVGD